MKEEQKADIPIPELETPFENIALAFSGGGFRAAAFALGTLSYMNELKLEDGTPLLKKVTYLSSASGGTIATAMYSLNSAQGKSFGTFYKKLFENLEGVKLLDNAMEILNDKSEWDKRLCKNRNMINAFGIAYDNFLFDEMDLSSLIETNKSHLDEVCFNTTEFYRGLLFRQNVKLKHDSKTDKDFLFGNFIIQLNHKTAANLKLADLLAASSCFPGGFEPIIFPDDFINKQAEKASLVNSLKVELQTVSHEELERLYEKDIIQSTINASGNPFSLDKFRSLIKEKDLKKDFKFGLMDGGITDNQGIESLIKANQRRLHSETDFKPFDFMMINDVGSHFMKPYKVPEKPKTKGISIKALMWISAFSLLFGIALMICGISQPIQTVWTVISEFVGLLLTLASSIILIGVESVKKLIRGKLKDGQGLNLQRNFSKQMVTLFFRFFGSVPFMFIWKMTDERINSLLTLNNDVFLKRIRYLLYEQFFSAEKWTQRVKSNHIYDMTFSNDPFRMDNDSLHIAPSQTMQEISEAAFEMGTTLWFDSENQKDYKQAAIIATGQFTTCYNLLEYISRLKDSPVYPKLSPKYKERVDDVENSLNNDYSKFKNDPFWLYNQSGKYFEINGFEARYSKDFSMPADFKGLRE